MFTIIAWIIIGLIAGAIARLILPGRQGSGWLGALITGLLGAVLGGWISTLLGGCRVSRCQLRRGCRGGW